MNLDIITLELIKETLISIVKEMRVNLTRTAFSSIIYEGEDFSCVLMSPQGEIVAMPSGQDHPVHIIPVSWSVKSVNTKYGTDIHPGDVFLHNDPYTGGTHLNDIAMLFPVFVKGKPFLIPVIRAHWGDVGGMTPGSISGQVTEIYQEGVRIPAMRIISQGVENEAALELMFNNMRIPSERKGDFEAMLGACKTAGIRIQSAIDKFGHTKLGTAMDALLARSENRMRTAITQLSDGTYHYEAYLEGGQQQLRPIKVKVALTVAGDTVTVDFEGSSKQQAAPLNVGPGSTAVGVFTIIKSFLDPWGDVNQGALKPINVIAEEGSILNARLPAPAGGSNEIKYCVEAAVMGALSQAIDGQVSGDIKGGSNHLYVGGSDSIRNKSFIFYEYPAGGTGANALNDGNNACRAYQEGDITSIQPIESVENLYPLRVHNTILRSDSGGDGKTRGGLGVERRVEVLVDDTRLSVLADHCTIPPYGINGGGPGSPNQFTVLRNGVEIQPSSIPGKVTGFDLLHKDIVVMKSSGGGGCGNPLDRPMDSVLSDLSEGLITSITAANIYGVVLHDGDLDYQASVNKRKELRKNSPIIKTYPWHGDSDPAYRQCFMSARLLMRLSLREGDLIELYTEVGAPVRAWILSTKTQYDDGCYIEPDALDVLNIKSSGSSFWRLLHR